MLMEKTFKLGFMPTRRSFFSKEAAQEHKRAIYNEISKIIPENVTIYDIEWLNDEGLLYSDLDAEEVANYFIKNEIDAIFAPHCNFGTENAVAQVGRRINKPLLIWGPRDDAPLPNGRRLRDSQCGLFATSRVLQLYKIPFTYIISSNVTDNVFRKGFINFIKAANVVKFSKNGRIGQVGPRPQSFYSLIINENELLEKFGIEIIPIDLGTIVRRVKESLENEKTSIEKVVSEITGTVDFSKVPEEAVRKIAALKYIMKKVIREFDLQAVAFQCWDELQFQLGVCSCYIHASITEEGTPISCESDIHGAISSLMLQAASMFTEPTFFSDLTIRHPENNNAELLWHCGAFPPSLAENKEEAVIGNHFVLPSNAPGTCNWQLKKGDITVIRFDGINNQYSMFCGEGKAIDGPYTLGTYVYIEVNDWPKWEEKIIYGPYIHHTSCISGKYAEVLYEALRYIEDIKFDPVEPSTEQIQHSLRNN